MKFCKTYLNRSFELLKSLFKMMLLSFMTDPTVRSNATIFSHLLNNCVFVFQKKICQYHDFSERPGDFTLYRGFNDFKSIYIFKTKNNVLRILCCSFHFPENSVKWQLQPKNRYFFKNVWFQNSMK